MRLSDKDKNLIAAERIGSLIHEVFPSVGRVMGQLSQGDMDLGKVITGTLVMGGASAIGKRMKKNDLIVEVVLDSVNNTSQNHHDSQNVHD